ncbi:MAG: molybdenum cofactor biosynthesis protein MoaE [Nitrososphaerota archaeon]|nr:molybdenum cofactor biosynthesis protein MoaE [Nitrososphaerota archaeon]
MARLTKRVIDLTKVLVAVQESGAGGTTLFIGTVRDNSEAGTVDMIRYQAYEPMAEKRLQEIEEEAERRWPMARVSLVHRLGELAVGEVSVAVAVSAPHRAEAFEACRYIIERIKRDVPIWKKERLAGGREVWVEGHTIGTARKRRPR